MNIPTPDGLFNNENFTENIREPQPTRTPTQEYVLHAMPDALRMVKEGTLSYAQLRQSQAALLDNAAESILGNTDERTALVTQLDLAFMLGGYLPSGSDAYVNAPSQLLALLDYQAETFNLPNRMDYELIIDVNTEEFNTTGHMRTYLNGPDAQSERDFYLGHHVSESYLKQVASSLDGIVVGDITGADIQPTLQTAQQNLKLFREYMAAYMRLSATVFDTSLRPYLATYPDGIRNASGAFMPSVQLTELALHAPTEQQTKYIDMALPYFPRATRAKIENAHQQSLSGKNLADMITAGDLSLDRESSNMLNAIVEEFITFRTTHLAVVRHKIPQAFVEDAGPKSRQQFAAFGEPDIMADGEKGTADFHIVNFLAGSVHRLIQAKRQLDTD